MWKLTRTLLMDARDMCGHANEMYSIRCDHHFSMIVIIPFNHFKENSSKQRLTKLTLGIVLRMCFSLNNALSGNMHDYHKGTDG